MSKEDFSKKYRTCFVVYPFKQNGVIEHVEGRKEIVDKNGYRTIRDQNGVIRSVSHIIYAVGCSYPNFSVLSYLKMKNVIISYKDGNRANCNFDNLICKYKKSYKDRIQRDRDLARYI